MTELVSLRNSKLGAGRGGGGSGEEGGEGSEKYEKITQHQTLQPTLTGRLGN